MPIRHGPSTPWRALQHQASGLGLRHGAIPAARHRWPDLSGWQRTEKQLFGDGFIMIFSHQLYRFNYYDLYIHIYIYVCFFYLFYRDLIMFFCWMEPFSNYVGPFLSIVVWPAWGFYGYGVQPQSLADLPIKRCLNWLEGIENIYTLETLRFVEWLSVALSTESFGFNQQCPHCFDMGRQSNMASRKIHRMILQQSLHWVRGVSSHGLVTGTWLVIYPPVN